jgi:hypothetical protein
MPNKSKTDEFGGVAVDHQPDEFGGIPVSNLAPQLKANPNGPQDPNAPTLQSYIGSGSNILNNAVAGGSLGSAIAPGVGTAVGAGLGGLVGMFQKPSEHPMTDLGETAGNLAANAVLPGASSGSRLLRLLRAGGVGGATYGGGQLGAQGDKQMQFVQQTPEGPIILSSALSAVPQFLKAMSAAGVQLTPVGQMGNDIQAATGINMPMSAGQKVGFGSGLEKMFTQGSGEEKALAYQQSSAIKSAVQKIIGKELSDTPNAVDAASGAGFRAKGILQTWINKYKEDQATNVSSEEPTGILDSSGNPVTKTVSTRVVPSEVDDWGKFAAKYGINDKEKDILFDLANGSPKTLVDSLMPGRGQGSYSGISQLRVLLKVLPSAEQNKVGTATALRLIDRSEAFKDLPDGPMVNGTALNTALTRGSKQLDAIFSPEQAEALKKVGKFAEAVNPGQSINPNSIGQRLAAYGQNKGAFTIGGALAGMFASGGAQRTSAGDQMIQVGIGGLAGTGIMVSMSTLVSKVLKNPALADTLLRVSKGDATASTALVRSLVNGVDSQTSSMDSSPADRLKGLFK